MYLVTGGAGFIGSHIVEKLVSLGERVRVLDNFSSGKRQNLSAVNHDIELIEGDITDKNLLRRAMEGVRVVLHQAALRAVPLSVEKPVLVNRVNVEGTLNVLVAAKDVAVKRVVYASSSSVYGQTTKLPNEEQHAPRPVSPYAVSKLAGEHYCRVFTSLYGLETVSLRYFNVYGPRQDPQSTYAVVIPRFIHWALTGNPLQVHGDGLQSRDFTYIDDVVNANLLAARAEQGSGKVFNIANHRAYSLLDLVALLEKILKKKLQLQYCSSRPGDVRHTLANISRAARHLDYKPMVPFEAGLTRTVDHLLEQSIPPAKDATNCAKRLT
jgi:UDP-glucose 4-epimerase